MDIAFDLPAGAETLRSTPASVSATARESAPPEDDGAMPFDDDWDDVGSVVRIARDGTTVIDAAAHRGPGAERGLASRTRFDAVDLTFKACLGPGACLLAKVHQVERINQMSNSYHLYIDEQRAYLARHHHTFRQFESPRATWTQFRLVCADGALSLWRNGRLLHRVHDKELSGGFAFVGAQGGSVRLRDIRIANAEQARTCTLARDNVEELVAATIPKPRLSIVTTVYDRTSCLRSCIASVQRLGFRDFEHLIVADHPPTDVMASISEIVSHTGDARIGLFNLARRFNNWGIAPAAAGLRRARGEFVAFLSDDNGYTPDHFQSLLRTLERDRALGFVYSSCLYDGRLVLNYPVPRPGRIDLGQPLFRRELFELHFDDDLPFDMMAWDWHLIDALMRKGVRWRHVDQRSFIFRLDKYPQFMAA